MPTKDELPLLKLCDIHENVSYKGAVNEKCVSESLTHPPKSVLKVKTHSESLGMAYCSGGKYETASSSPAVVKFGKVVTHFHAIILGDNPSCSKGAPLALGWQRVGKSIEKSVPNLIYNYTNNKEQRRKLRIPEGKRERLCAELDTTCTRFGKPSVPFNRRARRMLVRRMRKRRRYYSCREKQTNRRTPKRRLPLLGRCPTTRRASSPFFRRPVAFALPNFDPFPLFHSIELHSIELPFAFLRRSFDPFLLCALL